MAYFKNKIICLLGSQRSGTHYLRAMLKSSGLFLDCEEVFSPDYADDRKPSAYDFERLNFWRFKTRALSRDPYLHLPLQDNQRRLFHDFLEFIAAGLSPTERYAIIDVKYNSAHSLNEYWIGLDLAPNLFYLLTEIELPIIHLVRKDLFSLVVSNSVSNLTKCFHIPQDSDFEFPRVKIGADQFRRDLSRWHSMNLKFQQWVTVYFGKNLIELVYEEIDTPEKFLRNAKPKLESGLGVKLPNSFQAWCRKGITNIEAVVENVDELRAVAADLEIRTDVEFRGASSAAAR